MQLTQITVKPSYNEATTQHKNQLTAFVNNIDSYLPQNIALTIKISLTATFFFSVDIS